MVRRGNFPSINQHREEEEEEGNEAGGTPEPGHVVSPGQGAVGEAVDVKTSSTELGQCNVLGNALGGTTIPPGRRVNSRWAFVRHQDGEVDYRTYVITGP